MLFGQLLKEHSFLGTDLELIVRGVAALPELEKRLHAFYDECASASAQVSELRLIERLTEYRAAEAYSNLPSRVGGIQNLPIIQRSDLAVTPMRYVLPDSGPLWMKRSSGTSGLPLKCFADTDSFLANTLLPARKIAFLNDVSIDRPVQLIGVFRTGSTPSFALPDPLGGGALVRLVMDERHHLSITRTTNRIANLQCDILASSPSLLKALAQSSTEFPGLEPKLVVSSGAQLSERLRNQLQKFFRAPVCSVYTMSEAGLVASECRFRDGWHVDVSELHVEIAPDGNIILSTLGKSRMPLIRYRTTDTGIPANSNCPCGIKLPLIKSLRGKEQPLFQLEDGRFFDSSRLSECLTDHQEILDFSVTNLQSGKIMSRAYMEQTAKWHHVAGKVKKCVRQRHDAEIDLIMGAPRSHQEPRFISHALE